jgi:acetyl esterase/lipase
VSSIPFGGLVLLAFVALAVRPIRRPRRLGTLSWLASAGPNELPFVFAAIVVVSTVPEVLDDGVTAMSLPTLMVAAVTLVGLAVVAARSRRARPHLEAGLGEALGHSWRAAIDPELAAGLRTRPPWLRIVLMPWPLRPRNVERVRDLPYGDGGERNLLDVYRRRDHPAVAPTLLYFHGGRFRWGRKSREARALLYRLAGQGWTCMSADYLLSPTPAQGFPGHLVDVKRAVAWARSEGLAFGVDPTTVLLAGSSAGAHLATMAALTPDDPAFQPGFEGAPTAVTAAVGFGGYYGPLGATELPSSPSAYVRADAPPVFVVHGSQDTCVDPANAVEFVERLRAVSTQPVAHAELPGAQHGFDWFGSIRYEATVDAVEAFAAWVRSTR